MYTADDDPCELPAKTRRLRGSRSTSSRICAQELVKGDVYRERLMGERLMDGVRHTVGLPERDDQELPTMNVADHGHDLDRLAIGVLLVPFAEEQSAREPAGCAMIQFGAALGRWGWYRRSVRLGSLPDACSAGARGLCFVQSRRSQHVTTREEAQWLLGR